MSTETIAALETLGLVPMVKIEDAASAAPLAEALLAGNLPCAEITFRTDAAEEAIGIMASRGDMLVGAGTVLSPEQVDRAVDAGATFVVAPGTNPWVIQRGLDRGATVIPGVATPTDVESAMGFGLTVLKFFPAGALGGTKTLKAISAPYSMVGFVPTGGVNGDNLAEFLSLDCVLACGGSWLAKTGMIAAGRFDEITEIAAGAVETVSAVRG